jgi:hypothetical protein
VHAPAWPAAWKMVPYEMWFGSVFLDLRMSSSTLTARDTWNALPYASMSALRTSTDGATPDASICSNISAARSGSPERAQMPISVLREERAARRTVVRGWTCEQVLGCAEGRPSRALGCAP